MPERVKIQVTHDDVHDIPGVSDYEETPITAEDVEGVKRMDEALKKARENDEKRLKETRFKNFDPRKPIKPDFEIKVTMQEGLLYEKTRTINIHLLLDYALNQGHYWVLENLVEATKRSEQEIWGRSDTTSPDIKGDKILVDADLAHKVLKQEEEDIRKKEGNPKFWTRFKRVIIGEQDIE